MPNHEELHDLLVLLREHGVLSFRSGDTEIVLGPPGAFPDPVEDPAGEDEKPVWHGLTRSEMRKIGAES